LDGPVFAWLLGPSGCDTGDCALILCLLKQDLQGLEDGILSMICARACPWWVS
jgi:hypothetical protein